MIARGGQGGGRPPPALGDRREHNAAGGTLDRPKCRALATCQPSGVAPTTERKRGGDEAQEGGVRAVCACTTGGSACAYGEPARLEARTLTEGGGGGRVSMHTLGSRAIRSGAEDRTGERGRDTNNKCAWPDAKTKTANGWGKGQKKRDLASGRRSVVKRGMTTRCRTARTHRTRNDHARRARGWGCYTTRVKRAKRAGCLCLW